MRATRRSYPRSRLSAERRSERPRGVAAQSPRGAPRAHPRDCCRRGYGSQRRRRRSLRATRARDCAVDQGTSRSVAASAISPSTCTATGSSSSDLRARRFADGRCRTRRCQAGDHRRVRAVSRRQAEGRSHGTPLTPRARWVMRRDELDAVVSGCDRHRTWTERAAARRGDRRAATRARLSRQPAVAGGLPHKARRHRGRSN